MVAKISAYLIACYFLLGSMLLPLGDFSLMKDLPQMYHTYTQLASPEEQGILDFVGDYLLNGKALLGHNKHDAPETSKQNVQYQHVASFCSIVEVPVILHAVHVAEHFTEHKRSIIFAGTSDFHPELFRPPLTAGV